MAKKKKPTKKPATKKRGAAKAKRPAAKRAGKKAAKKAAKKAVKKTSAPKVADGLRVVVSPALETRLKALATSMGKSLDDVLAQAVEEFADTWEEHQRTVAALNDGDDRMQLVVPRE